MEARQLIGREVEGRFGAMHPTEFGAVVAVTPAEFVIGWDDGRTERVEFERVLIDEEQKELLPVGIFVMPFNHPAYK